MNETMKRSLIAYAPNRINWTIDQTLDSLSTVAIPFYMILCRLSFPHCINSFVQMQNKLDVQHFPYQPQLHRRHILRLIISENKNISIFKENTILTSLQATTLLSIWSRVFFLVLFLSFRQSAGASVFTHEFKIVLHNFDISKRVFFYRSSIAGRLTVEFYICCSVHTLITPCRPFSMEIYHQEVYTT